MSTDFTFWDVQHGHALYVNSPNNRHIVVDLGTGSYGSGEKFSPLAHLYYHYGVKQIDYGIVTHPHLDHIDDIEHFESLNPKVFRRANHLTSKEIMEGVRDKDRQKFLRYVSMDNRYDQGLEEGNINDPSNPENYGGLIMKTFGPSNCPRNNFNNHSVVVVFQYAGLKVIIPGDNESCSWEELLGQSDFMVAVKDADVLLAPHHGRESGWHTDVMKLINPRLTIISDASRTGTSAQSDYGRISRGWTVQHKRSGGSEKRFTVSTYNDGVVNVSIGTNKEGKPFLSVRID